MKLIQCIIEINLFKTYLRFTERKMIEYYKNANLKARNNILDYLTQEHNKCVEKIANLKENFLILSLL